MYCKAALAGLLGAAFLLCVGGCGRKTEAGVRRVALPPFTNLSGDPSLDWVSAALPAVLEGQLADSRSLRSFWVRGVRDAYAGGATHILHGYYTKDASGNLRVQADLEDFARPRSVIVWTGRGRSDGVLHLADLLARRLDPAASPYSTKSDGALRDFAQALVTADGEAAIAALHRSLQADNAYGAAYIALAQRLVRSGKTAEALETAEQGLKKGVSALDRARLRGLIAELRNDETGRVEALRALAKQGAADLNSLLSLGELEFRAGRYREALDALQRAAGIDPSRGEIWNSMGYSQAFLGDFEGARVSLEKYRALAPENPNALDSLGDLNFHFGRFKEAEEYYLQANDEGATGGAELFKAAEARWMAGDSGGATVLHERFLEARRRANDPSVVYLDAQWKYMTGRQEEAVRLLEGAIGKLQGDAGALARAELALWKLDGGQRKEAAALAGQGVRMQASGAARVFCLTMQFAASEAPSAELRTMAERTVSGPSGEAIRQQVLAWSLLFRQQFAEAAPLLEKLQAGGPWSASRVGVARDWSLVRLGRAGELTAHAKRYPLPGAGGEAPFGSVILPRWFLVRSKALAGDEATSSAALFAKYAGNGVLAQSDRSAKAQAPGPTSN